MWSYLIVKHNHGGPSMVLFLIVFISVVTADTFITLNSQCPESENNVSSSCTTLSQYAKNNETSNSVENVTLNLLNGVHLLNFNLSINASLSLTLQGNRSSDTIISCNHSARLRFQNIQSLHIDNLVFIGCVENIVESVEHFTLVSSTFQYQEIFFNGTALFILNTASSVIEECTFDSFTAYGSEEAGVLTIHFSNVSIFRSVFTNNSANYGGVVYVGNESIIDVTNTTFQSNGAFVSGGVFYVQSSSVVIRMSEFYNNFAPELGGVMYANSSIITFGRSVCNNNEGFRGGVVFADESTIYFQDSNISNNTANRGSVAYANFSSSIAIDSIFTQNVAGRGGVVYVSFGKASFMDCHCEHNSGSRGGVAYLFNSSVTFDNTIMYNNSGTRGGAVYAFNNCSVLANNSYFHRNRASLRGGLLFVVLESDITIQNSTISGNSVERNSVIYAETNTTMYMLLSTFSHNTAGEIGAIFTAEKMKVTISDCKIFNNSSPIGVIIIAKSSLITRGNCVFEQNSGSFLILNSNATFTEMSEFYNNTHDNKFIDGRSGTVPELGGAITCLLSDVLFSGNTNFLHNHGLHGGAIVAFQCRLHVNDIVNIINNTVDSTGGGIYATLSSIAFRGTSTIMSNGALDRGGGIHAISTSVELFSGTLLVANNSATFGGGLFIEQNAKLYVIKEQYEYLPFVQNQLRVELSSNKADYGGAIYVADNSTSGTCASNLEASLTNECFFQILQAHISIRRNDSLNLENLYFANNSAKEAGATIFGGLLDRCTPGPNAEVIVNDRLTSSDALTYLTTVSDITDFSGIASEPLRVCFCQENNGQILPDCGFIPGNITVMRGERFTMLAAAVDETNKTIPATIRSSLSSKTSGLNEGQLLQQTSDTCSLLEYNIASTEENIDLLIFAGGPCRDQGRSQRSVTVVFKTCECGIGFQNSPSPSSCECVCDPNLSDYITDCHNDTLSRTTNFWIDYTNVTSHKCIVLFPNCPYDYCNAPNTDSVVNFVNLNVPDGADSQCAFNRTGLMCGSCQNGLSLSLGTSNCMKCSNSWIALFILFAIFGIVLVSFVLLFNLTVAVGSINGLIFYANIVIANRAILMPFSEPAKYFFISWINLDWGFETCFYDGMDAYSKTWLQFVFPFYVFFIVIAIIVISEKSTKFSKLLAGRNPVAALATLILLSYTKLLRTIIAALSYADLECVDGSGSNRVWLFDANVAYFEGKHIPLFIAAIIVVIFSLLYTFLLLFGQWLPLLPNWKLLRWINGTKFKSFIEVYHAPYQPKHRYWVGLLLLVRVFLYLVSAYNLTGNPYISLYSVIFALTCLLVLRDLSKSIYKNWALGALETTFLLNVLVFSGATLFVQDIDGNQAALAYTSVYITLALLFCILVYHFYTQFIVSTYLHQMVMAKLRELRKYNSSKHLSKLNGNGEYHGNITTQEISLEVIANEHPDEVTERYHEPLLDDNQHSGSYILVTKEATMSGVTHTVIDGVCEGTPPLSASMNKTT